MRTQYEYMHVFLLPRMCKGRWLCHGLECSNSVLLGSLKEAETQESSNCPPPAKMLVMLLGKRSKLLNPSI